MDVALYMPLAYGEQTRRITDIPPVSKRMDTPDSLRGDGCELRQDILRLSQSGDAMT